MTVKSVLCEKHFNPEDVETESQNLKKNVITPNSTNSKSGLKREIANDDSNESLKKKIKNNLGT